MHKSHVPVTAPALTVFHRQASVTAHSSQLLEAPLFKKPVDPGCKKSGGYLFEMTAQHVVNYDYSL